MLTDVYVTFGPILSARPPNVVVGAMRARKPIGQTAHAHAHAAQTNVVRPSVRLVFSFLHLGSPQSLQSLERRRRRRWGILHIRGSYV